MPSASAVVLKEPPKPANSARTTRYTGSCRTRNNSQATVQATEIQQTHRSPHASAKTNGTLTIGVGISSADTASAAARAPLSLWAHSHNPQKASTPAV